MVLVIIIATCIVSIYAIGNPSFFNQYLFSPYRINRYREHIRWVSCGFLHGDQMHLFFNMFSLYFTMDYLEVIFQPWEVVLFYLTAIAVSGVPDFIKNKNNPQYSAIGASGAVSAALFSILMFDPWSQVRIFFIIPLPFIVFAILYLYYSYYMSKRNLDNIGHLAHFTGALFGLFVVGLKYPAVILSFLSQLMNPPSIGEMFRF